MREPSRNVYRVGSGNVDVNNPAPVNAVQVAVDTRAHSWGWSEGRNIAVDIRNLENYHDLQQFGFEIPTDANDCVMMVRKDLTVEHFSMTKASKDLGDSKVGHARTFSMVTSTGVLKGVRPLCHIAIHPNWVEGLTDGAVVNEYVKSMKVLTRMIRFGRAMSWDVVVSGDFNLRRNTPKQFLTTYDVFHKEGFVVRTEGLDGVAISKRLEFRDWYTIDQKISKSDHPEWIIADIGRK